MHNIRQISYLQVIPEKAGPHHVAIYAGVLGIPQPED
jgi:hypothetical protein